jgi:hypothetical protein
VEARGSVVVEAVIIFHLSDPSNRSMALVVTQPLTQISTRNLPGGKAKPARKADVTAICNPIV